jgi:hypothetical protein
VQIPAGGGTTAAFFAAPRLLVDELSFANVFQLIGLAVPEWV